MHLKNIFIIIASSLAVCQNVLAEELTELDFLSEKPLLSSSTTRLNQKINDIPASLSMINRKELMRLVPGFQVGFKYGNESTVTYHGLSGETNKRLHVLIDPRSTYNLLIGGTLWQTLAITLDDIHYTGVVRGPNATTYGAKSFSGVINIKTYSALEPDGTLFSLAYSPQR
ncbi:MAG: TonB-dependent receptor plug domain-containing protein, partial [Gammaproteobacteria bacterium]